MARSLYASITMVIVSVALPLRAADKPHAGTESQNIVWTNDDLARLHVPGLICIVGQRNEEPSKPASLPKPYVKIRDEAWYAEQAAKLRDELERRQAQLSEYRQGLEDARSLKEMQGGINLDESDIGITPQAGIEILQGRVRDEQVALGALEDLARRDDIPPGELRGQ
jgi:hypothetical protein